MSKFNVDKIKVNQIRAFYHPKTATKVYERPFLVQYESQHFKCKALVELEESVADNHWTIGLIQACDRMYLENRYGKHGSSFWEFHPLKTNQHKMVNDSDGRQYPFYSLTSSKCEIPRGVVRDSIIKLQYADHFYPTVAWELPYCGGVHLTDVIRKQDFWIWLVAIKRASLYNHNNDLFHVGSDEIYVLRTMRWKYTLHMEFDPHQRIGNRLKKVEDIQTEEPSILNTDKPIPLSAVHPPHCNAAQSLIWYPQVANERPDLLVPPRQTIVPWEQWVTDMLGVSSGRGSTTREPIPRQPRTLRVCPFWSRDADIGIYPLKFKVNSKKSFDPNTGSKVANVKETASYSRKAAVADKEERNVRHQWAPTAGKKKVSRSAQ